MQPHFPPSEADRQTVFYVNDCAESYFDGGGTYRECGPSVEELAAHLSYSIEEVAAAVRRLTKQGFLSLDGSEPITGSTVIYPTTQSLVGSPSFAAMSVEEAQAFIAELRG